MVNCGIDFGTSNSALAVSSKNEIQLASVEGESQTLPSALFYQASTGAPLFGRRAIQHFFESDEGRFMRSLKRILGTSLMKQTTVVNGRAKKFDHIIGDFLKHLKKQAEDQFNLELENAVIGRPVHFIDGDIEGDKRAENELSSIAKSIGFKNVAFQFEPIAAAFAHEKLITSEKLALVVDIGGGTSDFTIIRLSHERLKDVDRKDDILSNAGIRVGGNDFDKDLSLSSFMPAFGYQTTYGEKKLPLPLKPFHEMSEWSKVNFLYTPKTLLEFKRTFKESHAKELLKRFLKMIEEESGHKMLAEVEQSKINLTIKELNTVDLNFIEEGLEINITRAAFDKTVQKHIDRIDTSISECLTQAGVREKDINLIILTGGTTETPILKNTIRKRFSNTEISEENKLSSVCLGLGFESEYIFK